MHLWISSGGRWSGFGGWKTDRERDRSAGEYWRHHRDAGLSSGIQRQTESAVSRRHPQEDREKEIDEAIRKVGLDPEAKKHVGKYSLGMRQRLGIAQAIMEEPSLLILDEPMNGLDNQGVQEMRQLFLKLKDEGKTILLASHNREDIAALCDTTVEIDRGKIVK